MNEITTSRRSMKLALSWWMRIATPVAICSGVALALTFSAGVDAQQSKALPSNAAQVVQAASRPMSTWDGPRTGPPGAKDKSVALIAEDLRNGGILGVARGIREAAKEIGWKVRVFDATGSSEGRDRAAADALASAPDGLIVIGADA